MLLWLIAQFKLLSQFTTNMWLVTWVDCFLALLIIERTTQLLLQKLSRLKWVAEGNRMQQSINWRLISTVHILCACLMSLCSSVTLHLIRVSLLSRFVKGKVFWCPIIPATAIDTMLSTFSVLFFLKAVAL